MVQCDYPAPRSSKNLVRMRRGRDRWYMGVAIAERISNALGTFLGWKMLEMINEDAFMNRFGGLFEVKLPFHTKAY